MIPLHWRFWPAFACSILLLRLVGRGHVPLIPAIALTAVVVLIAAYCLQAFNLLPGKGLPPARGWDFRRWPQARRHFFLKIIYAVLGLAVILVLCALLTGRS